jgi:hypothetical protein
MSANGAFGRARHGRIVPETMASGQRNVSTQLRIPQSRWLWSPASQHDEAHKPQTETRTGMKRLVCAAAQ